MELEKKNAPFNAVAEEYDAEFSRHPLGRAKRDLVHTWLTPLLTPETRVLELNGGTGEDALFLAPQVASIITTDASEGMLDVAREKLDAALPNDLPRPRLGVLRIEELWEESLRDADTLTLVQSNAPYDLILSNFDGLNCVEDHNATARALHRLVRPGGDLVLVFMTRHPWMEKVRDLLRGDFRRMLRGRGVIDGTEVAIGEGNTIQTWFPPVVDVIDAFRGAGFDTVEIRAIGLLLPPTTMKDFYLRHQKLFNKIAPTDRLISRLPIINRIGDHVLLHLRRSDMCEVA